MHINKQLLKLTILSLVAAVGFGCSSTGVKTISGQEARYISVRGMLNAKIDTCGNIIPDRVVAQYAGMGSIRTLKDQNQIKSAALTDWKDTVNDITGSYQGQLFHITMPVTFTYSPNGIYLAGNVTKKKTAYYDKETKSAIPDKLFIAKAAENTLITHPYHAISNGSSVYELSALGRARESNRFMSSYYGEKVNVARGAYIHSSYVSVGDTGRTHTVELGSYTRATWSGPLQLFFGIHIDIPKWYNQTSSIIKKNSRDSFYIDSSMLPNSDNYNRDDQRTVEMDITYVYKIDGCNDNKMHGTITEVHVSPRTGTSLFDGDGASYIYYP
jgi:hypothetical protein